MANPRLEPGAILYNNKRVGQLQKFKFSIKNGATKELADSGAYSTKGKVTCTIQADAVSPVAGFDAPMLLDLIKQKEASIVIGPIDAKLWVVDDALPTTGDIEGDIPGGKQMATFNWEGGEPKPTG